MGYVTETLFRDWPTHWECGPQLLKADLTQGTQAGRGWGCSKGPSLYGEINAHSSHISQGGATLKGHRSSEATYGAILCPAAQFPLLPNPAAYIPPPVLFLRALVNTLPACMFPSQSLLHGESTKDREKISMDMLREERLMYSIFINFTGNFL